MSRIHRSTAQHSSSSSSYSASSSSVLVTPRAPGLMAPRRQRAALADAMHGDPVRPRRLSLLDDRGAATAEYAIATMAAVGFASLLVVIMRSDEVRGILTDMVRTALSFSG